MQNPSTAPYQKPPKGVDMLRHGSLFSGIGGFDLSAQWMGWENVFHCEWNEFGKRVLKYHFPKSISHHDIKTTDFTPYANTIDVLSGGFPCQPYSQAGKRLGKDDDRHLWPEMLRAVREIRPRYVVGENVRGLTNWNGGLVFDEVQADLEAEGYEVLPFLLPACAVNAPHRRDRVWFVAYRANAGLESMRQRGKNTVHGFEDVANSENIRQQKATETERERRECEPNNGQKIRSSFNQFSGCGTTPNTTSQRSEWAEFREQPEVSEPQQIEPGGGDSETFVADTERSGGLQILYDIQREQPDGKLVNTVGESPVGQWQNFPTQPPICGGNDGISDRLDIITVHSRNGRRALKDSFPKWRAESVKAYGNAIVPQVAFEIFKAIQAYENQQN